jgi:hypothetical protein
MSSDLAQRSDFFSHPVPEFSDADLRKAVTNRSQYGRLPRHRLRLVIEELEMAHLLSIWDGPVEGSIFSFDVVTESKVRLSELFGDEFRERLFQLFG